MTTREVARTGASSGRSLEEILLEPYTRVLIPDPDGGFTAEVLEFPGCYGEGDSPGEAVESLEDGISDWIEEANRSGQAIPPPLGGKEFGGKLLLRLPTDMHARLAKRAVLETTSINQLALTALASYVGSLDLIDAIADRIAGRLSMRFVVAAEITTSDTQAQMTPAYTNAGMQSDAMVGALMRSLSAGLVEDTDGPTH